ncbi:hypothetical protein CBM2598_U30039 [Cupriavidus taiwanensis]|uniref:Uncharacterized protein n=1 Tax=Cupriavidus taiwanensis TaxID=164546 RepID=A0A7Z7JG38_9BURK|nr:hypothetical protein CBM2597_U30037 [Cupriavidus taiwanensis]SOZ96980.1 hypothetical protein CBM2598_U30039 [Cupriavidus taiwanensis]SPC25942.1 hypothetical protein CBM2594_U20129 [Cupriavidus taiwanensis]
MCNETWHAEGMGIDVKCWSVTLTFQTTSRRCSRYTVALAANIAGMTEDVCAPEKERCTANVFFLAEHPSC